MLLMPCRVAGQAPGNRQGWLRFGEWGSFGRNSALDAGYLKDIKRIVKEKIPYH
jgi:hypothetical protein